MLATMSRKESCPASVVFSCWGRRMRFRGQWMGKTVTLSRDLITNLCVDHRRTRYGITIIHVQGIKNRTPAGAVIPVAEYHQTTGMVIYDDRF